MLGSNLLYSHKGEQVISPSVEFNEGFWRNHLPSKKVSVLPVPRRSQAAISNAVAKCSTYVGYIVQLFPILNPSFICKVSVSFSFSLSNNLRRIVLVNKHSLKGLPYFELFENENEIENELLHMRLGFSLVLAL